MNRSDSEFMAIADRVVAMAANASHLTVKNIKKDAAMQVFSSNRVKAALYRSVMGDVTVSARKEEARPEVKATATTAKKASKKEERVVRIMEKFGCSREVAEEMAV